MNVNGNRLLSERSEKIDENFEAIDVLIGLSKGVQSDLIGLHNIDASNAATSSSVNQTAHPINPLSGSIEEIDLKWFISPYRNQPYYQCIPTSSFALNYAPPRPLYDIIRDPLIRDVDSFIAETAFLLVSCYRGVDAEDRLSDMKIGSTVPLFMKLCIEYIDNFQRINERNVSLTYSLLLHMSESCLTESHRWLT
jgi:hypothetical protein